MTFRSSHSAIFVLLCAVLVDPAAAQTAVIVHGRVVEAESGAPIPKVQVRFVDGSEGALTDYSGWYQLSVPHPGAIHAEKICFEADTLTFQDQTAGPTRVDFSLKQSRLQIDGLDCAVGGDGGAESTGEAFRRPTLWGRIIDAETGEPVAGAQIAVEGLTSGTLSDREGVYALYAIPEGTHTLSIAMRCYQPISARVSIYPAEPRRMDFGLPFLRLVQSYSDILPLGCNRDL